MDAPMNKNEILNIIEAATAESIAVAKPPLGGDLKPTAPGTLESNLYSQFSRLFIEHGGSERLQVMREFFPAVSDDMPDLKNLHIFLKDVAEMLGWSEPNAVRRLLGIPRPPSPAIEPIKGPETIEDEHLLEPEDFDDLDTNESRDKQIEAPEPAQTKLTTKSSAARRFDLSSSSSRDHVNYIWDSTDLNEAEMQDASRYLPRSDLPASFLGSDTEQQDGFEVLGPREVRAAEEGNLHQYQPFPEIYSRRHGAVMVERYDDEDDEEVQG